MLLRLISWPLHLVVLVRHAPKVAGRRLNRLPVLHDDLEVFHLELPGEEHTLVALAFRLKFVTKSVVILALMLTRCRHLRFLWVPRVTSEAATHAILTIAQG